MNLLTKLTTALRGGAREAAEAVVDANSLRIFEQEIHDCETAIHQAKHDLCHVMAQSIKLERDIVPLEETIRHKEAQAVEALRMGEDELAQSLAGFIAQREELLLDLRDKSKELEAYQYRLKQNLSDSVRQVQEYRRELSLVKATASAQKASRLLAESNVSGGSKFVNLAASLERIKQQQSDVSNQIDAMAQVKTELSDHALDERLKAAGILGNKDHASEVLKRIRDKASSGSNPG